jgi:predicted hotdog family 3-hydroxylacyl-ACP dehydratase
METNQTAHNPLIPIEALLPHGEGMRLIDAVVAVDALHAVTRATVQRQWPMVTGESVSPLLLIEVAAQAAGVYIGWNEQAKPGADSAAARGWLVGVKQARFYTASLALGCVITIRTEPQLAVDLYKEIAATLTSDDQCIAEVYLQVMQAAKSPFSGIDAG